MNKVLVEKKTKTKHTYCSVSVPGKEIINLNQENHTPILYFKNIRGIT